MSAVFAILALLLVVVGDDGARSATGVGPPWKILVLIYPTIDFAFEDASGPHHVVGEATQTQRQAAVTVAKAFVLEDIPALDSGQMNPTVTVRVVDHALTDLDDTGVEWWPSPANTAPDLDPAFDSVIVIWNSSGTDLVTGEQRPVNASAGLTPSMGTQQTYTTLILDAAIGYGHRNVFKHEFGHSLLAFFHAAGTAPLPSVENHASPEMYVHCPTGAAYVWEDETNDNPIPNSIYNNGSGFTHDYYSGTTATPDQPTRCLGITAQAWTYGGPFTRITFSPTEGYPGALVTISGRGFTGTSSVTFSGVPASFTVNSDARITSSVPQGATTGHINVATPTGTFTSRSDFTIHPFGFTPQQGSTGTAVVISGFGLTGTSAVRFNGTPASFTVNSDTKITASVPKTATTGPISLVTPSGTLTNDSDFGVVPKLKITSISPDPFDPSQGQSTTITWTQDRDAHIEMFAEDSAREDRWDYLGPSEGAPAGTHSVVWDGKTNSGAAVPYGTYTIRLLGWDTTGYFMVEARAQVTLGVTGPVVRAPVPSILPEQRMSLGPPVTVVSKVTWSSTSSNLCSYRLQRSVNGAAFADLALSSPTATKVTTPVAVGSRYRFRVRATSCDGTVGPWSTSSAFTVRGSQQGAATYSTGWAPATLTDSWGGTVRTTSIVGTSVTFAFTGRAIAWVGTKGPAYGSAEVYVDGALIGTVSVNGLNLKPSYVASVADWGGTSASHTLTIVNEGTRLDVDGFIVFS